MRATSEPAKHAVLVLTLLLGTAVAPARAAERSPIPDARRAGGEIARTGTAPAVAPVVRSPAAGWAGEQLFGNGNDWEPAVAADPGAPYVYMLTTRYSGPAACSDCPIPYLAMRISSDGGATFGPAAPLCPCAGMKGQFDPQIEAAADGSLYAAFIGGNRIKFTRSADHGVTWTAPVDVDGSVGWGDHPWIAVSASGQDVYIAFNHSDSYVAASHDFGVTWQEPIKTNHAPRYHYVNGGYVAPDGAVTFSQESYSPGFQGPIWVVATRSADGGATWQTTRVDVVQQQPKCENQGCRPYHYGGQAALAGDASGDLVIVYDGALVSKGAEFVFTRRSTDGGATWGPRLPVSPAGGSIIASFPAAAGTGSGDIRLWYMDDRNGVQSWNTWFRSSTDGGLTWSPDVRISDAVSGPAYVHPRGFDADYGDYGEMAVTSTGATFAVWGEGFSYQGPGGTWYNRSL